MTSIFLRLLLSPTLSSNCVGGEGEDAAMDNIMALFSRSTDDQSGV